MKSTLTATIIFAAVLASGCSEQNSSTSGMPSKVALTQDIPSVFKGLAFEGGGKCAIDQVNKPEKGQVITISKADGMNVDGWALNDIKGDVPAVMVMQLVSADKHNYYAMLTRHGGREDLVTAFGKAGYAAAGYSASVDIANLPAGTYDILVIQNTPEMNLVCSTYRKLSVTN